MTNSAHIDHCDASLHWLGIVGHHSLQNRKKIKKTAPQRVVLP